MRQSAVAFGTTFGAAAAQIAIISDGVGLQAPHRPAVSPGFAAVGIAITALAATSGWAFLRVLRRPDYHPDRPAAIRAFLSYSAFEVLWTGLWFGGRHPAASLLGGAVLVVVATVVVRRFAAVDGRAGLLIVPRVLATAFAFFFVLSIYLSIATAAPSR